VVGQERIDALPDKRSHGNSTTRCGHLQLFRLFFGQLDMRPHHDCTSVFMLSLSPYAVKYLRAATVKIEE
jgi:hypothetical protein